MMPICKAQSAAIATLGVDLNTFHPMGLDKRGAIVLRKRQSRAQIEVRLANMRPA